MVVLSRTEDCTHPGLQFWRAFVSRKTEERLRGLYRKSMIEIRHLGKGIKGRDLETEQQL